MRGRSSSWALLVLGALGCLGLGMRVEDVPNPGGPAGRCVADPAGVLPADLEEQIDGLCRPLEQRARIELAVVCVDDLEGATVEGYARRLFDLWGIGKRDADNGVLVLLSRDDREIRVEVGRGLLGVLTDARVGELLDQHAIPRFKEGRVDQGLLELTRALVELLSSLPAEAPLDGGAPAAPAPTPIPDAGLTATPAALPAPAAPAEPPEEPFELWPARIQDEMLALSAGMVGFGILGSGLLTLIVLGLRRTRAGKKKSLGRGILFAVLLWLGSVGGAVMIGADAGLLPQSLPTGLLGAGVLQTLHGLLRWRLRKHAVSYRRPCAKCKARMDVLDEAADDAELTTEEQAEERIEGMDWEVWRCPGCGAQEKIGVSLGGASKCGRCKRRTLTVKRVTLREATYDHSGEMQVTETCHNPNCSYHRTYTRSIPRKTRSSSSGGGYRSSSSSSRSSSSSSSRSSGGGYGGGRSGGGGASRKW